MPEKYRPELDATEELDDKLANRYLQYIGILRWAVELGRVDILLEVSLLSTMMAQPRRGHLEAVYSIFMYLDKHENSTMAYDHAYPNIDETVFTDSDWTDFYGDISEEIPLDAPVPRGKPVVVTTFVDSDHAGNLVTRRSHTGIITFINKAPINWYSKRQNTVESSTFGSEFVAMRTATEMNRALRYKLRMMGVPIEGPTNFLGDNNSVVNCSNKPEARLSKKHNQICFHTVREAAAMSEIRVGKEPTETNLADLFTKMLHTMRRRWLLQGIYVKGSKIGPEEKLLSQ